MCTNDEHIEKWLLHFLGGGRWLGEIPMLEPQKMQEDRPLGEKNISSGKSKRKDMDLRKA
jgi:hypothetical protein